MSGIERKALLVFSCAVAALLMGLSAWTGCGGFPGALAKTHEGVKEMSQEVEPRLAAECLERAKKCKADGVTRTDACAPLTECRGWKSNYALGVKQTHRGLANCNAVYFDLKKAKVIE